MASDAFLSERRSSEKRRDTPNRSETVSEDPTSRFQGRPCLPNHVTHLASTPPVVVVSWPCKPAPSLCSPCRASPPSSASHAPADRIHHRVADDGHGLAAPATPKARPCQAVPDHLPCFASPAGGQSAAGVRRFPLVRAQTLGEGPPEREAKSGDRKRDDERGPAGMPDPQHGWR